MAQTSWSKRFPHQLAWLIDNPLRRLIVSPERLAARLPLSEGSHVLEIGPGSGYFSLELARRLSRGRLELFDVQPEMLAKARSKLEGHGLTSVGYTVGDAGHGLPFDRDQFDVVLLVSVLGEVSDQSSCLRSIHRVLNATGSLIVHESLPDPDRIRPTSLRQLVEPKGFVFRHQWGPAWNYTAHFAKAAS